MTTRLHHVHASLVHAPIMFIPAAALVDLQAVRSRNRMQARLGRTLWWLAVGSAAAAGVAGMAASQEVEARAKPTQTMMWLHGTSNVVLLLGTIAMASWRQRHRPTPSQTAFGLAGMLLLGYSSWLGGMLVYEHGVGVSAMPERAPQGVGHSAKLLSFEAPTSFLKDALRGAWWLLSRARTSLGDRRNLRRAVVAKRADELPSTKPSQPEQTQYAG